MFNRNALAVSTAVLITVSLTATIGATVAAAHVRIGPMTFAPPVPINYQPPATSGTQLADIECPTVTLCVAVDIAGNVVTTDDPTGGSAAWTVANVDGTNRFVEISCASSVLCVAGDAYGNVVATDDPTGGSAAWTVTDISHPNSVTMVSCPTTSLCVAIDSTGRIFTSTNPAAGSPSWNLVDGSGTPDFWSLTCPTATLCVGGDYSGNVMTSTDPAGGPSAWTVTNVDGSNSIEAISCPSVAQCIAVDNAGNVVTSTDPTGGATAWTVTNINGFWGLKDVSCPTTSFCVAIDWYGTALTSTDPTGGVWAWTRADAGGPAYDQGVSCASELLCLIADSEGNVIIGTYDPPGLLRVVTSPAVPSLVTVDGNTGDTWGLNWLKMTPGSHEVCFSGVVGYATPNCEAVSVSAGATSTVTGDFAQLGTLRVVTSPAVPSTISIDGSPADDWGVWTDLSPGSHQVCFGAVADFATPACQDVTVTAGTTSTVTGSFSSSPGAPGPAGFGLLRVTTSPAVPSRITVDGHTGDTWGLNWVKMTPGSHEVCFSGVVGYATPSCEAVSVSAGATSTATGDFAQLGTLRVVTSPAVPSTISIDGSPADDWGVWTDLSPGSHQVCFGAVAGYIIPTCQTVATTAGTTTILTGTFFSKASF